MEANHDDSVKLLTWPDQRLLELLRIEHPIILAPMGGFATSELAASVCAAGGLGSIGCAGVSQGAARDAIAQLRARTARPINVNFSATLLREPTLDGRTLGDAGWSRIGENFGTTRVAQHRPSRCRRSTM
jgi:NAD(P)H-dependent flavin oxidoreductase YrpB (nitropropane dioxygenase family)